MAIPNIKLEAPDPTPPSGGTKFTFNGQKYDSTTFVTYFTSNFDTDPFIRNQFYNSFYGSGYFDSNAPFDTIGPARVLWQRIGEWAVGQAKKTPGFTLTASNLMSGIDSVLKSKTKTADFGSYLKTSTSSTGAVDTTSENQSESYYEVKLKQFAHDNGIIISDKNIKKNAKKIAFNKNSQATTFDEVTQWYREKVIAPKYSQFADDIKGGSDVKDLAHDYIAMISNSLEIDPENVDLAKDPLLNKALLGYAGRDGKTVYPNYTDFQRMVKQDSRWQYTSNAKDDLSKTAQSIKQIFGL